MSKLRLTISINKQNISFLKKARESNAAAGDKRQRNGPNQRGAHRARRQYSS